LAKEQEVEQITSSAFLQKYHISGSTTARRTVQALIDKGLVLAIPQKKGSIYQIYDVFFMHWLEREYWECTIIPNIFNTPSFRGGVFLCLRVIVIRNLKNIKNATVFL
jgi:hypothetical protein